MKCYRVIDRCVSRHHHRVGGYLSTVTCFHTDVGLGIHFRDVCVCEQTPPFCSIASRLSPKDISSDEIVLVRAESRIRLPWEKQVAMLNRIVPRWSALRDEQLAILLRCGSSEP